MANTFRDAGLQAFFEESLRRASKPGGQPAPPLLSYLICATPRCGSNLLCEALSLTGQAGTPLEYFEKEYRDVLGRRTATGPDAMPFAEYFRMVLEIGTGRTGVFGAKVMWSYFEPFLDDVATVVPGPAAPAWAVLARVFPNLHYLHISRADKVRQAVSLAIALQSDQWVSSPSSIPTTALTYDFQQIESFRSMLVEQEREWERFFEAAGVEPYRITYEQFVTSYEQTARDVLAWLGLPPPEAQVFARRKVARMASGINDEWHQRFVADARRATWKLEAHAGSTAHLERGAEAGDHMRVSISNLPGCVPWHVKLRLAPLEVLGGQHYVLAFRARADAPRRIGWAVGQAQAPWGRLSPYAELDITTDWQAFECPFVAEATEANARVFFDLGTARAAVEFSGVVLRHLD